MSEKEVDFEGADQGVVSVPSYGKTRKPIWIEPDVLDWFRQQVHDAGGGNYQTLINAALHEHMLVRDETMERVLRKVTRKELQAVAQ